MQQPSFVNKRLVRPLENVSRRVAICYLDQYKHRGGGQQILLDLLTAAQHIGLQVSAMVPAAGDLYNDIIKQNVPVHPILEPSLSQGRKGVMDILRLCAHILNFFIKQRRIYHSPDLFYVNGPRLIPHAIILGWLFKKPYCIHIHLEHSHLELKLLQLAIKQKCNIAMVVPSEYIRRQMIEFHPSFGSDKLRVIENGLTTAYAELLFENRFTCGRLRSIVVIGRLSPEKGHDAIQAAAACFPDVDFHILGASDFSIKEWQQYLKQIMPKNVHFYGKIDDIPRKVRALKAQVCIVPSRCNESFGLVAIEGMALSCLTIVRNKGGLAEIAKKTHALTFVEDEELIKIIDNINSLSDQQLKILAKKQYTATMTFFGSKCYFQRLEKMLVALVSNSNCEQRRPRCITEML